MKDMSPYKVDASVTIREAFRKSALNRGDCVFVTDCDDKVLGIVTDGDFRRAIWAGVSLEQPVSSIVNGQYIYFGPRYKVTDVIGQFSRMNIRQIPVLRDGKLLDVIVRDDFDKTPIPAHGRLESIPAKETAVMIPPYVCQVDDVSSQLFSHDTKITGDFRILLKWERKHV